MLGLFDFLFESSIEPEEEEFVNQFVRKGLTVYKQGTIHFKTREYFSEKLQLNPNFVFHFMSTPPPSPFEGIRNFYIEIEVDINVNDFVLEFEKHPLVLKYLGSKFTLYNWKKVTPSIDNFRIQFIDIFSFENSQSSVQRMLKDLATAFYEIYNDKFYIF